MSRRKVAGKYNIVEKIVVVFDMCSPTKIVERLILRNNLVAFTRFIRKVRTFLEKESDDRCMQTAIRNQDPGI